MNYTFFSVKEVDKEKQVDHILLFAGETGLSFYNSWGLPATEQKNTETVWERFTTQVEPKTNFRMARLFLQKLKQGESESMDDFVSRCELQAQRCNFRDELEFNERIIEQVITGTRHTEVQKDLLSKEVSLTMDQVLDVGRTHEASLQHIQQLKTAQGQDSQTVHFMKRAHEGDKEKCAPGVGTRHICGKSNAQLLTQHAQSAESRTTGAQCRLAQPPSQKQGRDKKHQPRDAPRQQRNRCQNSHTRSVHEVTHGEQFSQLTIDSLEAAAIQSERERGYSR